MKDLFIKRFQHYKDLADDTIAQLNDNDLNWTFSGESTSVAVIIKHLSGNMISHWTDFLTEDGEKSWRNRDEEFDCTPLAKVEIIDLWEKGWSILFQSIESLDDEDCNKTILIRGKKYSAVDGLLRQLAHYSYHVGQLVYISKLIKNERWKTLSGKKSPPTSRNSAMLKAQEADEIIESSSPVCYAKSDEVRDDYKI